MIIYPTIELQRGRCVTLNKGRLDEPMIWHVDPIETARSFAADGAEWMLVYDYDAVEGRDHNSQVLEDIIRSAGIPVMLAGGFRSRDQIINWIEKGAGRIVVGTLAAQDPGLVKEMAKYYPDQIVLSVDVWQGQVMIEGRRGKSALDPATFIAAFAEAPLAGVIITDVDSEIEDTDGQLGLISGLAEAAQAPVIASGIVRGADDIARLKYVPYIAGAVVGRALFRKTLALSEALEIARAVPEPVAAFK